ELDLSGASALALRVRGDGKIYQLRLRDEEGFDGVNHCAEFLAPAGQWTEVLVPLASLEPRYRGRVLRDVPPLDRRRVRTLGLLISEKQEGPFRLEIEWIRACGPEESTAV
ncbi:MAG: CIA30 family protein, partial [Planctomycetota bacterium]